VVIIGIAANRSREMIGLMNAPTSSMNRKHLVNAAARFGLIATLALLVISQLTAGTVWAEPAPSSGDNQKTVTTNPLKPPAQGQIPIAFVISEGAVVIDFGGPWEVFRDVNIPGKGAPFRLYTVSDKIAPITVGGGMKIVPDYTFANAPTPKVIVIPAQSEPSKAMLDWIRQSSKSTDVTMSVCTGAFVLAKTGLLDGKSATTFHSAFTSFAMEFPKIELKRGARFVENGNLATSGGLSSGIDLALRVVERYYGREVAAKTAYNMEYQGQGWMDANSNQTYAVMPVSTAEHPLCPVCGMDVDVATAPKSLYKGTTYYFCSDDDKKTFDAAPDKFADATLRR
jgi:putative intracellular protease/amidase/YHS domain-containing protein